MLGGLVQVKLAKWKQASLWSRASEVITVQSEKDRF